MTIEDRTSAQTFRRLHEDGLLVLPNAWDAVTARLIESLGAKAIATSSAAVAWSHGYADSDLLPVPKLLAIVEEIVRAVRDDLVSASAGREDKEQKRVIPPPDDRAAIGEFLRSTASLKFNWTDREDPNPLVVFA
jgi:hypothetical protein